MDLHTWIVADLAGLRARLIDSVISAVPAERWHESVDGGGSTITHLLLHLARHQDLAVTTAIRNHPPRYAAHRDVLGLGDAPLWAGLAEREDPSVTMQVTAPALLGYVNEVFDASSAWTDTVGTMALDTIPDTSRRLAILAGLPVEEVPWLHRMWADKAVWWLVQWPVLGHGHAHTGEAISVRNRMGLSPF